jgi:hypothetical protein
MKKALAGSWLGSIAIVSAALFATPYMRKAWRGEAVESLPGILAAIAIVGAIAGWPWLVAAALEPSPANRRRQAAFSVLSVLVALGFHFPIANGHDFSIGFNVILCIVCIWAAYPASRWFVEEAGSQ